jgi:hypothetical protein
VAWLLYGMRDVGVLVVGNSVEVRSELNGKKMGRRLRRLVGATRGASPFFEALEARTLLSATVVPLVAGESATAQLRLVSTSGSGANQAFTYDITVTDTGSTTIGTFWFAWEPGLNFLPTKPSSATSPAGWGNADGVSSEPAFTGPEAAVDGTGIQWVAHSAGALIQPGQSLSGFEFTTHDTLAQLAGDSPTHPGTPATMTTIYSGVPFSDAGSTLVVSEAAATGATASATTLGSSAASVVAGNAVTLTATVAPVVAGTATPTGTVDFVENGATIGTGTVGADGTAAFTTSSLAAGTHTITADYLGDSTYAASVSSAVTETVTAAPQAAPLSVAFTKLTLGSSAAGGQKTNAKATVVITNGSGSTFKGKVTVAISVVSNGTSTVVRSVPLSVNIKAGRAAPPETVALQSLPNVATGSYGVVATVTDASQNVSTATFATPVTITAPFVLLGATAGAVTPATIVNGKSGAVTVVVSNGGNIDSTGVLTVNVGLVLAGVSTPVGNLSKKVTVKTTKPLSVKMHFKVPKGMAAGAYSLVATVSQGGQTASATSATTVTVA